MVVWSGVRYTMPYMPMNKTDELRILITKLAREAIVGSRLLAQLKARGQNQWRASVVIAEMAKAGLLDIVKGKYDDAPGKTKRQVFLTTERGYAWATAQESESWEPMVDIEETAEKALERPGKWFPLDERAGEEHMQTLRSRGFDVRIVIRYGAELEGKVE